MGSSEFTVKGVELRTEHAHGVELSLNAEKRKEVKQRFADSGVTLWALGTTAHLSRDEGQRMLARQMFERGLPHATELGPRGTALTMLGLTEFLARHRIPCADGPVVGHRDGSLAVSAPSY